MAKRNLLVDLMNKSKTTRSNNMLSDAQSRVVNRNTATNINTVNTPDTPISSTRLSNPTTNLNLNLRTARATVDNQSTPTQSSITTNNPYLINSQLPSYTDNEVLASAKLQSPTLSQSRFIWFQNNSPVAQNTTIERPATEDQWKSLDKFMKWWYLYIPTNESQVENLNKSEEERYNKKSEALQSLQYDIYKHKRILTEDEIKTYYEEFADNIEEIMKLQKELRPIIASWNMVSTEQLEKKYSDLLKSKDTKTAEDVKKQLEKTNKNIQNLEKKLDKVLKTNWEWLSANWVKYVRDWNTLFEAKNYAKNNVWVVWGANDAEILEYIIKNNPEYQKILHEAMNLELTDWDKSILGVRGADIKKWVLANLSSDLISTVSWESEFKPSYWEMEDTIAEKESAMVGKEKLESDFWRQTWRKIATEIWVPLDSLEKAIYRGYKDAENKIMENGTRLFSKVVSKSYLEDALWVNISDEDYNSLVNLFDTMTAPSYEEKIKENKQRVLDYTESVNKSYESRKRSNLDPDIENYVNNRSMTRALLEWDLKGFTYKAAWEAAQNAEMPLIIAAWVVAPEVTLPLMALDSYARESQESFEELMEVQTRMGISQDEAYDNAQEWAVIVWLASATVELALEKLLWWVETTASSYIRETLMKDFTKKATEMVAERWLVEILKQWAVDQFKSSLEEWLEEILQQAIHNKAIQQYDPDQKITEWMLEAFEWGFFNLMNLTAWGSSIIQNINQNSESLKQSAYQTARETWAWAGRTTDNIKNMFTPNKQTVDRQNLLENTKNKVTSQNIDNWLWETAIVPTQTAENNWVIELKDVSDVEENTENENTEIQEKDNTAIKESLGDKAWEYWSGVEENTRNRMRKNPYSAQENKRLIDTIESDPWIDINDYLLDRYETVLDDIVNKLEKEQNKRKDIWKLYDKLEETNAPIDATNIKNRVWEFQQKMEDLWDILSTSDQSKINTILKNIQEIWDWTMDIWKVRKIADGWAKWEQWATNDWIRLIREIRNAIDEEIRNQRPEMKEVDQEYEKSLDEIKDLRGNIAYKRTGEIKGNAVNIVKNMLSGSNRGYMQTLEKYIPWVKQRLQAIRDVKFVYNAYETWSWSRFQSGIFKAILWNIFKFIWFASGGMYWAIVWAAVDAAAETGMKSLTRKAIRETLTKETERSRAELEKINQKIEEWKQLDEKEKQKLKELGEKIMKNWEQMAKTKAEKEAWNKYMEEINDNITPQTTEEEQEKNKVTKKKSTKKNKVTEKKAETKKSDNQKKAVTSDNNPEGLSLEWQPITDNITINEKNASLIDKNLEDLSLSVDKLTTAEEFLYKLKSSMLTRGNSIYVTFDVNGQDYTLRISNHSAYAIHSKSRWHTDHNTSIVIKVNPWRFRPNAWVNLIEYVYYPDTITDEKMKWIIKWIKDLFQTWEYTDTNYDEINKSPTPKEKQKPKNAVTNKKSAVTEYINETPQNERGQMEEIEAEENLRNNETPQRDMVEEAPKNKTEVTAPKQEENQTKIEVKPVEKSELREKIGDRFYDYLQKQVDIINENRKEFGKEPITVEDLNLNDELYINKFEKIAQEELSEIQNELSEINKDLPQAPALTDNQREQLNKAENQTERNKLLRKRQDEWLENNPISEERAEQIREIMERAADIIEQHNKARNYIYDSQIAEENKEYEDKYSEESKTKATTNAKNKVTNTEKSEKKSDSEHFSYETYWEFMKKYEAAEKEINDRLDKQMDKERAEKMERFNELTKKEDKTDAEWNEMMKLAGELNNMSNRYDRLKEEEFNKKHPELVAEKQRQNEMFDRDWKAVMDKKMEEINKPFNNLRDKYLKELRDELWIADGVTLDSDFYNSLTPEQKKIADEINKEYAEKYEELRQKTASIKKIEEESKTKITKNKKNKVTNPSRVKEVGLFNENEVDKGNKPEWLNPDALPLSDYREMQRLNDGEYYSLSNALWKRSLKLYMAKKIATELVWNYDEIIADEFDPDNLEDKYVEAYNDVIDMYEGYEEYSDLKNDGDTDINTLKNTLSAANSYADKLYKWKTAKELIDQYKPEYESDLKVYNRLIKKYPSVFANWKIDLTWAEGKARREFANQENETAQDIDYQELAERENETAQIPNIFEEDLQESNIRNLDENETAQTTEEEMDKVTKKQPEKPKNLVTAKSEAENEVKEEAPNSEIQIKEKGLNTEENDRYSEIRAYFQDLIDDDNARIEKLKNNTLAKSDPAIIESHIKNVENRISKYQEALAMGTDLLEMDRLWAELAAKIEENLKGQKRGWTKYFPVKESKVIENKDGSKVKYLTTTKWDTSVQWGLIEVTSPEWVKESFVVQKIGNWPREVRVSWNYMTVDAIQNLIDITNWEYKAPKKSEKSYKIEQTTSASPQEQFMDRFENVYDRDDIKKELSKVEEWEDIVTGKKYKGTKAQRMQFYVDNPLYKIDQESSYWARKYVGVSTDRWESKHYLYWIEYDYAKFLEDNPDIRNKPIEPLTLKQRIEDMAREDGIEMPWEWEEVKYEKLPANVSVREESKKTWLKRIAPDRVIWQQETFDEWYNNVLKAVNNLSQAVLEEEKYNEYYRNAIKEWRHDVSNFRSSDWKTIQDIWKQDYNAITDLWFKTRNSQEYSSLIKNIKEANWNEAALKSIAKNLYIKRVSDDIGKHYIYPEAVYEWKPDLLKAKTKFEAYLKWYNTSFSNTDSRIDYSMKDTLGAWVKRQDWNQITKAQKDWILANSLYYGRMFNLDIKKLFSDLWITVVHLNWKNPFLTKSALWVYNPKTKSISVWNGEEKYSVWKWKDKQTKSVATTFGHELTHAIDFMLDKELFSDSQTRPLLHTFNSVVSDRWADYWDSKVEVTARMVEQYLWVEGMGRRDYFRKWGYWNEELYNTYIKPAVESAFKNKLWEYYKEWWSAIPEWFDIDSLIDEAWYDTPNSVTATSKNKVTSK